MMLCGLDWNALPARVSTGWIFSARRVKSSVVALVPKKAKGQVSDCEDLFIQTIAAGLSQTFIMDVLNDAMQLGLECFASKGLHQTGFELREGEKS